MYHCFEKMRAQNFFAEATDVSYWGRGQFLLFEVFLFHGLFQRMTWNRVFFNEEKYVSFSRDVIRHYINTVGDKKDRINLWLPEDRIKFSEEVKKTNKLYPGFYAPDGEEVDVDGLIKIW